jgi:hypothetical protein
MKITISVMWNKGPIRGKVEVRYGKFAGGKFRKGEGTFTGDRFSGSKPSSGRMSLTIEEAAVSAGAFSTIVSVLTKENPFSFFLRDVRKDFPIFIPAYGMAVTEQDDERSYEEIAAAVAAHGLQTSLQRIDSEPEESFENAAKHTRTMACPTWLGIGSDNRVFQFDFYREGSLDNCIIPKFRENLVTKEELEGKPLDYRFFIGRGVGCKEIITRRLDEGVLPILHGDMTDDDIRYECTTFATLEKKPLKAQNIRGTDAIYADSRAGCHQFGPKNQDHLDQATMVEESQDEEVVLFFRARARNTGLAPRYAFFETVSFHVYSRPAYTYDGKTGLSTFKTGRVFAISKMDGRPMPQEEMSVLLAPGETATMEFYLPHSPTSKERGLKLVKQDFDTKLEECRNYWKAKLASAARISVPEKPINEMIKAGLLHLELVMYGREPKGTVTPTIGVYSAIGSESSPIIQAIDSMAHHTLAERCLQYFIDIQQDNGFMQNYSNYQLETGAILWTMGEHFRYTRDEKWVKRISVNLIKACDYLIAWRRRNMKEEFRGKGYGLMDGKVADPEDPYHIFMLNGYSYVGMIRVAEMLAKIDPKESKRIRREAQGLLEDIRTTFFDSLGKGPVVPLGDGSWIPTAASYAEHQGPNWLYAQGEKNYTHGTFFGRDTLLGPIYLILQEVLDPKSPAADFLIRFQSDLATMRNAAFSQPYYSPHPWVHLKRGEIKPFLKAYYNTVSSLADRETYTFWEHYFRAGPHKTHEEAWFLMQTRWMLWLEEGETLRLLPAVPRQWLEDGKKIELENVAGYFGPISLKVASNVANGQIDATIECKSKRDLKTVEIRLPHPLGQKAKSVKGGKYDPATETVRIDKFSGRSVISLWF